MNKPKSFSKPSAQPSQQTSESGPKVTFLRLTYSRSGNLYAEATADIQIKKGEKFAVNDPRKFLSKEQVAELEENGEIELQTKNGKSYKLYSSLFANVVKL